MYYRINQTVIAEFLSRSSAVGMLGARRVGKTMLAKAFANTLESGVYLDLGIPQAQDSLGNASAFFWASRHRLVRPVEI